MKNFSKIKTWQDFKKLPFTTKKEIRHDQETKPIFGTNKIYPGSAYSYIYWSRGTTGKGKMISWLETKDDLIEKINIQQAVWKILKIKKQDQVLIVSPATYVYPRMTVLYKSLNRLGVKVVFGDVSNPEGIIDFLLYYKINILFTTPSFSLHLREMTENKGIKLKDFSLEKIMFAGEQGGSADPIRERIEKAWRVKCYDGYGIGEVGSGCGLATECLLQTGPHLLEDWFIFEIINPKTLEEVDKGELVVTNLWRKGFPLLRYRTGDFAAIDRNQCSCRLPYYRLKKGVIGRIEQSVFFNGKRFFPVDLEELILSLVEVREFRVEIDKFFGKDRITVFVELKDREKETSLKIKKLIKEKFEINPEVFICRSKTLPRFMGKTQRLIDNRKKKSGAKDFWSFFGKRNLRKIFHFVDGED